MSKACDKSSAKQDPAHQRRADLRLPYLMSGAPGFLAGLANQANVPYHAPQRVREAPLGLIGELRQVAFP